MDLSANVQLWVQDRVIVFSVFMFTSANRLQEKKDNTKTI